MIEFHAWEAKARPIRIALKLAVVLLPIVALIAPIPLLLIHHVTIDQPAARQRGQLLGYVETRKPDTPVDSPPVATGGGMDPTQLRPVP
jgi:hypothetical protein